MASDCQERCPAQLFLAGIAKYDPVAFAQRGASFPALDPPSAQRVEPPERNGVAAFALAPNPACALSRLCQTIAALFGLIVSRRHGTGSKRFGSGSAVYK